MKKQDKPKYSIVIPCFNEEKAIEHTIHEISERLSGIHSHEIIVVNDASTDATDTKLGYLSSQYGRLRIFKHDTNRGYGASIKTGIKHAKGKFIAITDADGSYPNENLPDLFAEIENYDMVVGARTAKDVVYPLIRKIPKLFLRRYASWLAGVNIPDLNSGMRVFKKSVYRKYAHTLPDGFSFTTTITMAMLTNGYEVKYTPIGYRERIGKSKIRPIRDTLNFIQLILRMGMYFAPLRVFMPVAGLIFAAAFASVAYDVYIIRNLTDKTVILLMFGINTCMFALLADMIDKRN
ncbi:MAG: glycosyltransferase family 2 protein [Gammaproteobacteria bacterium]